MADSLRLLFEIDVDSRSGTAGLLRFRKDIAATVDAVRRVFTQPLPASAFEKATTAAQKLTVQSLELANRLERARQAAERLALAQQRIAAAQLKAPLADAHVRFFRAVQNAAIDADHHVRVFRANQAALAKAPPVDAHVRAFKAIQKGIEQADRHVQFFKANQAALGKAPQLDAHVKAFRALQRGVEDANHHVRVFRAQQAALAKAPQLDAHVRAFRAIEQNAARARREMERLARSSTQLREFQQHLNSIGAAALRVGGGLRSMGASMAILVSGPLIALGRAAGRSAADIDAIRNRLTATEGSLEAANARLAQLRRLADDSIGVTRRTATDTFAILSTLGEITEQTINKQIRAFGRLNAAFTIDDQQLFFRNLLQIFQQGFEIKDIKEALGRVPIFNQLLESAFGTSDPEKLRQLKAAGKLTLDTFLLGLGTSVENNPVLGRIQESFTVRFAKTFERIRDSLEPLGLAILGPLERIVNFLEPIIVRIAAAFAQLPPGIQTAIVAVGLLTAALGPLLFILGGIASGIGAIATTLKFVAIAVAAVGLGPISLILVALAIHLARIVAVVGLVGLAWRNNFLNIRGLVSDAADAVQQAFTRIKAVFEEVATRVLPTLQSISTKVIGTVTVLWERYGDTVVRVISTSFDIVVRTLEAFIRFFGNVIDLVAKLIDGDWQGAWQAFARITINALDSFDDFLNKLAPALIRAFVKLQVIILAQALRFAAMGGQLAVQLQIGISKGLIAAAPKIRDALTEMFVLAAFSMNLTSVGAVVAGKLLASLRKAVAESAAILAAEQLAAAQQRGSSLADIRLLDDRRREVKRPSAPPSPGDKDKGADAAARRRIRILELEADKVRTLTDAQLAREQIAFDERRKSLQEFTDAQIKAAGDVLLAQLKIYQQERDEAKKIRNESARDLALAEIGQKEFEAQQAFTTKVAQLEAARRREELEAAIAHRQALLDIQDEGDQRQLELIDSYVERYLLSFEEAEERRLEIEDNARRRRRTELETQLGEAGQNVEEQQRIRDAIAKLDAESATAREDAESRKRRAIKATIEAENDYFETLQQITFQVARLLRGAAEIDLGRLVSRFGDRRRSRLEALRLEREANEQEHQERLRRIEQEKKDAEKRLEGVRDAEEKLLQLRRYYADLEKAERERRAAERRDEDQREAEERDPFSPLRKRLENFLFDVRNVNESIAESLRSASEQVSSVIGAMEDALQQGIVAWILYGESLGKALQKALAQQLAVLSAEFAIQALKHAAYALGSLAFGNFAGAAKHAAAAAAFTAAAAATGIAARALSKSSGLYNQGKSGTAASAVGGGAQPQNREFQYGGQVVEPSSTASREGSAAPRAGLGAAIIGLVEQVKQQRQENAALTARLEGTLSRIGSLPPGDVVTIGAADASLAIGAAVIQHSKENNDFNRTLAENAGF